MLSIDELCIIGYSGYVIPDNSGDRKLKGDLNEKGNGKKGVYKLNSKESSTRCRSLCNQFSKRL